MITDRTRDKLVSWSSWQIYVTRSSGMSQIMFLDTSNYIQFPCCLIVCHLTSHFTKKPYWHGFSVFWKPKVCYIQPHLKLILHKAAPQSKNTISTNINHSKYIHLMSNFSSIHLHTKRLYIHNYVWYRRYSL